MARTMTKVLLTVGGNRNVLSKNLKKLNCTFLYVVFKNQKITNPSNSEPVGINQNDWKLSLVDFLMYLED